MRALLPVLLLSLLATAACERIEPVRTLPSWVRGVYVPMVQNKTTEPGLEELATRFTQEEFLADGRLKVVQKGQADLQIAATISSYVVREDDSANDHIASTNEIRIVAEVVLLDPADDPFKPGKPIAVLPPIETFIMTNVDARSVDVEIDPDSRNRAMSVLARQIVDATINGFPATLRDQPTGAVLPTGVDQPRLDLRGNIFRGTGNPQLK